MLQPGDLRHRLTIEKPVQAQDPNTGAITETWQEVDTVWASIKPMSAREFTASSTEHTKVSTRITIRYRSDITDEMRLYHQSKDTYYDIHGILADSDSGLEYITLPCSTGVKYK